jgi:hypothetical protein
MLTQMQVNIIMAILRAKTKIDHRLINDDGAGEVATKYAHAALATLGIELGVHKLVAEHVAGVADHIGSMREIKKNNPEYFSEGAPLDGAIK